MYIVNDMTIIDNFSKLFHFYCQAQVRSPKSKPKGLLLTNFCHDQFSVKKSVLFSKIQTPDFVDRGDLEGENDI